MQILKQSTAVDVLIGPFVDSTDGYSAETGVSPSVKLSKNGQALAAKNDATTPVHDADGYYNCEFDATDTNTIGTLVLSVVGSATSLPVRHEFQVVEEDVYDTLFASGGALTNLDVNAVQISGDSTAADNAESFFDGTGYAGTNNVIPTVTTLTGHTAQTGDAFARLGAPAGASIAADIATVDTVADGIQADLDNGTDGLGAIKADTAAILLDSAELQADWANGGRLDLILDSRMAEASINTTGGAVDVVTTNTDMRGTDSALLAANVPTNFTDLAITATTGLVSVGTNNDKTGYSISGTKTTLDALNDISTADVNAECDTALTDYDAPTKAELDSGLAALNDLSAAEVNTEVDTALADYDAPTKAELDSAFTEIKGATWATTDTLEAIRDRGDAAWTTGAGGTPPQLLQSTTIATLASQTSFTLTAGSADDDAYNGAIVVVTDQSTSSQKAVGTVSDYTGSTKTVTLSSDPAVFTIATGDTVEIIAALGSSSGGGGDATSSNQTTIINHLTDIKGTTWDSSNSLEAIHDDLAVIDGVADDIKSVTENIPDSGALTSIAQASALATVDTNVDAVLVDTGTTLPAQITAQNDISQADVRSAVGLASADLDTQLDALPTAAENRAEMDSNSTQMAAIVTDTGTTLPGQISGLNNVSAAEVNAEVDTALADYDAPTKAELDSGFAALNNPTVATIADAVWDESLSGHATTGTAGKAVTDMESGIITGAAQTGTLSTTQASTDLSGYADDQLIARIIVWTSGACDGEATDITDYANTNGVLTFTALTTAPSNGDTFKIV